MFARFVEESASGQCAICDQPAMTSSFAGSGSDFICRRCGAYRISDEFRWEIPGELNPLSKKRYKISWAFRSLSEGVEDFRELPMHLKSDVSVFINAAEPTVEEKLGALLIWMAKNSQGPGKTGEFDYENDYALVCGQDGGEAEFLSRALSDRGWITLEEETLSSDSHLYCVTASGWFEIGERNKSGADSNNAFIAMSFSADRSAIGPAITSGIEKSGHNAIRMDRVEHSNRIDDEIIAQLRRSKFLVADLTEQNNGAYFEAGFMLGLGRTVIWICDKSDLQNVHFDTRQYNIIDYAGPEDLESRLRYRIEAIVGRGSNQTVV
jgi:hypothetical protein